MLIQLGAILAVVVVYFGRLWSVLLALPSDPGGAPLRRSRSSSPSCPAAVVGLLLHDFIKTVLFNSPVADLRRADRRRHRARRCSTATTCIPCTSDAMRFPLGVALAIGLFQCLAIVPGVSRSGATIAGALLMNCEKRAAAEFSFFLAIPTMLGAFVLDFYENRGVLSGGDIGIIAIGFVVSFVSALIVVRTFVELRRPPRLHALRLVADRRRRRRAGRALGVRLTARPHDAALTCVNCPRSRKRAR